MVSVLVPRIVGDAPAVTLRKVLRLRELVLFGIICVTPIAPIPPFGILEKLSHGQTAVTIAAAMIAMLPTAISYGWMATRYPSAGSAYTYAYTTVGEFGAWIMGALLLLEYALAASVVAVGWSGYAVSLLHDIGLNIPAEYTQAIGKLVVAHASTFSMSDPVVSLNGVTVAMTARTDDKKLRLSTIADGRHR